MILPGFCCQLFSVGYTGGGFALALLGGILPPLKEAVGEDAAWRAALFVPGLAAPPIMAVVMCLADDTPLGGYSVGKVSRPRRSLANAGAGNGPDGDGGARRRGG